MQYLVRLKNSVEPLHIPYPENYQGQKTDSEDSEFNLSTIPRRLTLDEITLAKEYVSLLPYKQSLAFPNGVFLDESDPLLNKTHDQLDQIEGQNRLKNTRKGGKNSSLERTLLERVVRIRQSGYTGNGSIAMLTSTTQK